MSKDKYPKVMMVGDCFPLVLKRVVFAKKEERFIAWVNAETIEESEKMITTNAWKYAKDIKPENALKQELLTKAGELIKKAEELKTAASKL